MNASPLLWIESSLYFTACDSLYIVAPQLHDCMSVIHSVILRMDLLYLSRQSPLCAPQANRHSVSGYS